MHLHPRNSDWPADRVAEARAVIADVAHHSDHLIRLACNVLVTHGDTAAERKADGLAHRERALRLLGNRVHPLAAAHAWRALAASHGLGPVDLAANEPCTAPDADVPF